MTKEIVDLEQYRLRQDADLFQLRKVVRRVLPRCSENIIFEDGTYSINWTARHYPTVLRAIQDLRINGAGYFIDGCVDLNFSKTNRFGTPAIGFPLSNNEKLNQIELEGFEGNRLDSLYKAVEPFIRKVA